MEEKADKSKIFDTMLSSLKETRTAFYANFFSAFALMLTALGLILGYEKIKPILEIDAIYYFSVCVLVIFGFTYSKYLFDMKKKAKIIISQLDDLNYMDRSYYNGYEISNRVFVPMLASLIVMFFVMILVLSWIKYMAIIPT